MLKVYKANIDAVVPTVGTSKSTGLDLYCVTDATLKPKVMCQLPTNICISVPDGCYARIAPRSGISIQKGVQILAGVLDCSCTTSVIVYAITFSEHQQTIKRGDRIAQLVLQSCLTTTTMELSELPTSNMTQNLLIARLSDKAMIPRKANYSAVGHLLFSAEAVSIAPFTTRVVKTDIAIQVPDGCYGRIAPITALAEKYSIHIGAGVIDPDYRGNLGVVIFNFSHKEFRCNVQDVIAQIILERIQKATVVECALDALSQTERGTKGFGSTS